MPTYDYECECGCEFDDFKPIADREEAECPKCGKMAKIVMGKSAPAISVPGGTSPSRGAARPSAARPADAIPMGGNAFAVPRRDKKGKLVKVKDLKQGRNDLPKDMQEKFDARREKHHMLKEAGNPNITQI